MDDLLCDGNETEIADCRFGGWGNNDCETSEAAGVICLTEGEQKSKKKPATPTKRRKYRIKDTFDVDVRISGGRNKYEGQVEVGRLFITRDS